jgi:hypothetical protein
MGVKNFALSFANSLEDVEDMRAYIGIDSGLISKVESFNVMCQHFSGHNFT